MTVSFGLNAHLGLWYARKFVYENDFPRNDDDDDDDDFNFEHPPNPQTIHSMIVHFHVMPTWHSSFAVWFLTESKISE